VLDSKKGEREEAQHSQPHSDSELCESDVLPTPPVTGACPCNINEGLLPKLGEVFRHHSKHLKTDMISEEDFPTITSN
jgi:hypothetical protein